MILLSLLGCVLIMAVVLVVAWGLIHLLNEAACWYQRRVFAKLRWYDEEYIRQWEEERDSMGIKLFSSAKYPTANCPLTPISSDKYKEEVQAPNPDPANYTIKRFREHKNMLLIEIHYPDCTNYEGRKILVYSGLTFEKLMEQKLVDPHFSDNHKYASPVARFEPTDRGWKMANHFIENYQYTL